VTLAKKWSIKIKKVIFIKVGILWKYRGFLTAYLQSIQPDKKFMRQNAEKKLIK